MIYSHSGRDISRKSSDPDEREVLIPAGTRFEVIRVLPETESEPIKIILIEVE